MDRKPVFGYFALTALLVALMSVWPLAHTIALRLFFFSMALICAGWLVLRDAGKPAMAMLSSLKVPLSLWVLLSLWILAGTVTYAIYPEQVLAEFWGQWLRSGLAGLLGLGAAILAQNRRSPVSPSLLLGLITLPLLAQVVFHDAWSLWVWRESGRIPFEHTIYFGHKSYVSFVSNIAMAVLCAELMARLLFRRYFLPLNSKVLLACFIPLLFCTYVLGTRNGMIGVIFLVLSCLALYGYHQRKKMNKLALMLSLVLGVAGVGSFAWVTVKADARWQTFAQTVPVALDTQTHRAWLNKEKYPYPRLPDGRQVEISAYERIAWMKEGALLFLEHPWGLGYSRSAFGTGLVLKYPVDGYLGTTSHSGILELALGVGVPGLLLWFGFLGALLRLGWRTFFRNHHPVGLILLFIVTGVFGRSLVDGNLRDHMMEQFLFLCGVLTVFASAAENKQHDRANE